MKKSKKELEEIETTKRMIKYIKKGYGKDKCKGYHPDCGNCRGQLLLGYLVDHLDLLGWEGK